LNLFLEDAVANEREHFIDTATLGISLIAPAVLSLTSCLPLFFHRLQRINNETKNSENPKEVLYQLQVQHIKM
jgi:hypothetical protein